MDDCARVLQGISKKGSVCVVEIAPLEQDCWVLMGIDMPCAHLVAITPKHFLERDSVDISKAPRRLGKKGREAPLFKLRSDFINDFSSFQGSREMAEVRALADYICLERRECEEARRLCEKKSREF